MTTQIYRDAVLAPVQILRTASDGTVRIQQQILVVEPRVLIIELTIKRPVLADELAETERAEWGCACIAGAILQVEAGRSGEIPAIVEVLRGDGLGHSQPT